MKCTHNFELTAASSGRLGEVAPMFLMMTRVPPALVAVTIVLAHLAVLFDIAIRRDLPWWRRLVTAVIVGLLLPLGALVYLLLRPVGGRMDRRIVRRRATLDAKGRLARSGWQRMVARVASVAGLRLPSLPVSWPALPRNRRRRSPARTMGSLCSTCRLPGHPAQAAASRWRSSTAELIHRTLSSHRGLFPAMTSPTGRARPRMA